MKTKVTSLLVVLLFTTISCTAQRTITVEALSNDISNNLDLQAVASIFGESRNLEDFEKQLNDYDNRISNLDLNNDGEVDYLRVVENWEDNVHLIVIQAILDYDIYQDVATIVVERLQNRRTVVQVIGDPYIYGFNYIIEPVYVYSPRIYSFFWGYNYRCWHSPYHYGYYPRHYRHRHPFEVNVYIRHIHKHINYDHRYYYSDNYRSNRYEKLHQSVRRNDLERRYPSQGFSSRNRDIESKRTFDNTRRNNTVIERSRTYDSRLQTPVERRTQETNRRSGTASDNSRTQVTRPAREGVYQNNSRASRTDNGQYRNNDNNRSTESRMERSNNPQNTPVTRSPEATRNTETRNYQERPVNTRNAEIRTQTSAREDNSRKKIESVERSAGRSSEAKASERKPAENSRSRETRTENNNRSGNSRR